MGVSTSGCDPEDEGRAPSGHPSSRRLMEKPRGYEPRAEGSILSGSTSPSPNGKGMGFLIPHLRVRVSPEIRKRSVMESTQPSEG